MQLRDISFSTPQENIAFDDVLLSMAESHGSGEYLRFWESAQIFIVMGITGKPEVEVNPIHTSQDQITVLKRSSGGGTVLQGPGCLNYTLVLSKQKHPEINDLRASYEWVSSKVIEGLASLGVKALFKPISDIAIEGNSPLEKQGAAPKKFSGNAQRRKRHYILHHGTLLYAFDLSLISRYLQMPMDMPEYRQKRSHQDFVTNIPVDPSAFKTALAKIFQCLEGQSPTSQELSLLKKICNS